jgi:hypothetical protein
MARPKKTHLPGKQFTGSIWFSDPRWLRRLLATPIRANRIPFGPQRDKFIADETAKRERAMFELYHIPADWPELIRWEWLARHLAGELFAGCRTVSKGRGGPSRSRRLKLAEQRRDLFEQFQVYLTDNPRLPRQGAAANFLKKNQEACSKADLTTAKGFVRAMKKIGTETLGDGTGT